MIEDDGLLGKYNTIWIKLVLISKTNLIAGLIDEVFLKECKYIEKKVFMHISDNLSDFSSDDEFDEE